METEVKRTQKDYTLAFKLSVVDQVEKGEMTYKVAKRLYGINGRSALKAAETGDVQAETLTQRQTQRRCGKDSSQRSV